MINKTATLVRRVGQVSYKDHQKLKLRFEEMMSNFEKFKKSTDMRLSSVEKRLS